jgi:hypothetical protein
VRACEGSPQSHTQNTRTLKLNTDFLVKWPANRINIVFEGLFFAERKQICQKSTIYISSPGRFVVSIVNNKIAIIVHDQAIWCDSFEISIRGPDRAAITLHNEMVCLVI